MNNNAQNIEVLFHVSMNGLDYNILINTIYEQISQSSIVCLHRTPEHKLTTPSRAWAGATSNAAVVMGDARDPFEMPAISRVLSTHSFYQHAGPQSALLYDDGIIDKRS